MSVQNVTCTIGGPTFQKNYTLSATDGQWNNLTDSVSSSDLGIVQPNQVVSKMTGNYAGGAMLIRIQDRQSLVVHRFGIGAITGLVNPSGVDMIPYSVKPQDIVQAYPVAVNATAGDSEVLAWVHMSKGTEAFSCTTTDNNTATSLTSIIGGDEVGDIGWGQTLTGFTIQCEDGATLNSVSYITADGGTAWVQYGTVRDSVGNAYHNMDLSGLKLPIERGCKLQVAVTTA